MMRIFLFFDNRYEIGRDGMDMERVRVDGAHVLRQVDLQEKWRCRSEPTSEPASELASERPVSVINQLISVADY